MRKWAWLAMAAGVSLAAPAMGAAASPASPPPPAASVDSDLTADAAAARLKAESGDFKGARADLEALIHGKNYALASPKVQAYVLMLVTTAEAEDGAYDDATSHWKAFGELMPTAKTTADYWRMMVALAYPGHAYDLAIDAYIQYVSLAPDKIYDLTGDFVDSLVRHARTLADDRVRYRKLLETLWQVHYEPKDNLFVAEYTRLQLLELLANDGDDARARALLATLNAPGSVIALRSDNRYRRLLADAPGFSDFKAVQNRFIDRLKAMDGPGQLRVQVALGYELNDADRLSEALALLDRAIGDAKKTPPPADQADQVKWLMDTRMRVLRHLGRWDEVVTAEIEARDAALKENRDLVSQKINLGGIYYILGRPKDALAEVADIKPGQASVYGQMSAEEVRACAYAQTGDIKALKASLELMRRHADEAPEPLRAALLCADDEDGVAALLVARLDNPDERNAALVTLQTYLPDPYETAFEQQLDARMAKVNGRPEVKAAIAKYGVIETYPAFSPLE